MKLFLGIDTSNYKTSAAVYDIDTSKYINKSVLLAVPQGKLGLRQSDAVFQHIKNISKIIEALNIKDSITAIGFSDRPRNVDGSYMPCFLPGKAIAESIASVMSIPCYSFSHQQGHLSAALFSAQRLDLFKSSFLAWHLSGGTTELLLVKCGHNSISEEKIIGGTTDISAGQLIDRAGVLLGLPFPAGQYLEKIADVVNSDGFAPKVNDCKFSLSGVENKILKLKEDLKSDKLIAGFTLKTICSCIDKATEQAKLQHDLPILFSGGVAANKYISNFMKSKYDAIFASPDLSGDNGVGVAVLASLAFLGENYD